MQLTREDLNRMWNEWRERAFDEDVVETVYSREEMRKQFDALLAAERAFIDREAQARAVRWALTLPDLNYAKDVTRLAARIESGEVEVP